MANNTTKVSWGIIQQVVKDAWKTLSKDKALPDLIIASRPQDFIVAGLLAVRSPRIKIGRVEGVEHLSLPSHPKLVLLSITCDDSLPTLIGQVHDHLSTLPFLYRLHTLTLFDTGFPEYDYSIFQLPYPPVFPWEYDPTAGEARQDTLPVSLTSHPTSPALSQNTKNPKQGE